MKSNRLFDIGGRRVEVRGDAEGVVSHAGVALLSGLADRVGLTQALGERPRACRQRASAHDPGEVLRDMAVALADGAVCVSDLAVLRDQPELFGQVASHATVWRTLDRVADDELGGADAIARARADARAAVWRQSGPPLVDGMVVLDFDATIVGAESDKVGAAGTFKKTYGHHPLLCYVDHGDGTGDPLAGMLRAGNAGSNTVDDHLDVLDAALAALPAIPEGTPMLVRADGAGATHGFVDALRAKGIAFSVGFDVTAPVREAIAGLDAAAWADVADPDAPNRAERRARPKRWRLPVAAKPRPQVAELDIDLTTNGWPPGSRLIARREARSPGEQAQLGDLDGYRLSVFLTDCTDDVATLDRRHRHHAHVEQRIRDAKDTGLSNLPHFDLALNAVWLELVLCAQALNAWSQRLLLTGTLAAASPKTLRHRLWHTAARVTRHARRTVVAYQRSWPWTPDLLAAFDRLAAVPPAPG
ncbi:MAG: IS1380 family transposase [Egibacteraceae bacterium]